MKRLILVFAALVSSVGVFADKKSETLLSTLQEKVSSWGDYRIEFTVTIDSQSLKGSYEVSGERYHVMTPDVELFCDGNTKWEVNRIDREVAIDRVDPADRTVMGNPTKLFDFMDGSYTHRYVGPALVNGMNCERIELKEKVSGSGQTIDVFVSASAGLPVRVGYTIGFMNTEATVDVVNIKPNVAIDASFSYDPKRYAGYETVDFR